MDRVAIVHDWLVTNAGSEKVLECMLELFPQADLFSIVDFLSEKDREEILGARYAKHSFIQHLPFSKKHFRNYLYLFPRAIESFDLSDYDLVLTSSWAFAKGAKTTGKQLSICYCHTPIRYAWDLKSEYLGGLSLPKRIAAEIILAAIRRWDKGTVDRVDMFIANSRFVRRRIRNIYHREAHVIYPPVDVERFLPWYDKEDYYLTVSRFVPYKHVDLIVEAFAATDRKLVVVGDGPQMDLIKRRATKNIELLGFKPHSELVELMQKAKAFVFAAVEDFGIAPVEALSCATPVIAYGFGGVTESVQDGMNGILYRDRSPEGIRKAVDRFERIADRLDPAYIRKSAERFSRGRFLREFGSLVNSALLHRNELGK